ncbi:hypothetical protein [Sandaracinus amylolyticus]|uniref:Uncharacterized protein n=1 Tax=Sandaracinus amylolyticus TaxID=927083 RepID=A0A0F6W6K2_9BACT|nr:hypothetical protein [Sandaracinus amylolyticus]AKF08558.1 hypothetical protein DB32_005707 [Sandaracinus amylolyticus]
MDAEHLAFGEISSWSAPDVRPSAFDETAIAVLESLSSVFVPLSVEARSACTHADEAWSEPEQHFVRGGVLLRAARPDVVAPRMYVGEHVDDVARISRRELAPWLAALTRPCPVDPAHVQRWTELWIESCAVRIFDPSLRVLRVSAAERREEFHEVAIDEDHWLAAPTHALRRALVAAPITLRLTIAYGVLHATLGARWSRWTQPTPEREALRAATATFVQHGLEPRT